MDYAELSYKIKVYSLVSNKKTLEVSRYSTVSSIKDKISVYHNTINNIPIFISLYDGNKNILKELYPYQQVIYYRLLLDELLPDVQSNIDKIDSLLSRNSKLINALLTKYKRAYTDINIEDMLYAVEVLLNYIMPSIVPLNSFNIERKSREYGDTLKRIKGFVTKSQEYLTGCPILSVEYLDSLIEQDVNESTKKIRYSILSVSITYKQSKDTRVNYLEIFNNFELDRKIPYIGYKGEYVDHEGITRVYPRIKFYNQLPKEIIKHFIMRNTGTIIKPYLLSFKVENRNSTDYNTLTLRDNSTISAMNSYQIEEYIEFGYLYETYTEKINKFIKRVNECTFNTIVPINKETRGSISINSSIVHFSILKTATESKIKYMVDKKFSSIFDYDRENNTLLYKQGDNRTIQIRSKDGLYKGKIVEGTSFTVTGITSIHTMYSIMYYIVYLFHQITHGSAHIYKKVNQNKKIQVLRELGMNASVSCQQNRQVSYTTDKHPPVGSYALIIGSNRFICENPGYPYPGYTAQNAVCCFKKDQRKKEIFIRNTKATKDTNFDMTPISYKKATKDVVITLNKLLLSSRIGLLPEVLRVNILKENYYRLGIEQNNYSFITSVERLINEKIYIDKLLEFSTESVYKSLNNGNIVRNISYSNFIHQLRDPKGVLHHTMVLDLISYYIDINIIVFDINNNSLYCRGYPFILQSERYALNSIKPKKTIYIVYNYNFYEPIIQIIEEEKKVITSFSKKESDDVYKFYKEHCIEPEQTNKESMYAVTLIKYLKKKCARAKITGQVINKFNSIDYIVTNIGLFPVIPSGKLNEVSVIDAQGSGSGIVKYMLEGQEQVEYIKNCIKEEILGQLVWDNVVEGYKVSNIGVIPVRPTKYIIPNVPIINERYYNYTMINNIISTSAQITKLPVTKRKVYKDVYELLKFSISKYIKDFKEESEFIDILKIIKKEERIDKVKNKLKRIIDVIGIVDKNDKWMKETSNYSRLDTGCVEGNPFFKMDNGNCKVWIPVNKYKAFIDNLTVLLITEPNVLFSYYKNNINIDIKSKLIIRETETVITRPEELNILNLK